MIALVFFINLALVIGLSQSLSRPIDMSFLSHHFLTDNLNPASRIIFDLSIVWILGIILALAGVYHLWMGLNPKLQSQIIDRGYNQYKWLMIAIIMSLVAVVTALLLGVSDLAYLLLICFSIISFAGLSLVGEYITAHKLESQAKGSQKIFSQNLAEIVFILQKFTGSIAWMTIGLSLGGLFIWSNIANNWIYFFIYMVGIIWFISLLLANYLHIKKKGVFKQYRLVEVMHWGSTWLLVIIWLWLVMYFINF